jgi:hypothetical protein
LATLRLHRLLPLRRLAAGIACALVAVSLFATRQAWLSALGRTLVCERTASTTQAILLDNLDSEFGLFRRGAELQRLTNAAKVLVPVVMPAEATDAAATQEVTAAFARVARLSTWQTIEIQPEEPISLQAAYRVRDVLVGEHINSVTLVTNGFRSRRSEQIYRSVLGPHNIAVACVPVFGKTNPDTWTNTLHGIQDVSLQFLKLQYYRFWVLPFRSRD